MSDDPVLVVGAGPTGLTAALVLARSGHPVRIVSAGAGPVADGGVQVHVVDLGAAEVRRRHGVRRGSDAVVLIRPDGHVGLCSQPADLDLLRRHLAAPTPVPVAEPARRPA